MELKTQTRNRVPSSGAELGTRVGKVADLIGTRRSASEIANVAIATLQRHIAGDAAPTFDALARLCLAAGVRMEWLATGAGPMLASESGPASRAEPDGELLLAAVQVIEQALALTRRTATPEARARLITKVYNLLRNENNVSTALNDVLAAVRASLGEVADGRGSTG